MLSVIAYAIAATAAQPATVKSGVEHWRAGEYPAAVAAWLPFAAQGDPDACFNLGQAYKLGRGVTKDAGVARDYYRRAAAKGHLPAQANLGIALFQAGDKAEAMRWLKQAADRGEPRAQYVLGIAAYNGDGTPKNLGLAYGYLLRAQSSGLAQATTALGSIEPVLKPAERTAGTEMAASLAAGTGVPAALAAASVVRTGPAGIQRPGTTTPAPGIVANAMSSVRNALGMNPPPVTPKPPTARTPVQTADATPGLRAPATRSTSDGFPVSQTTGDGLPVSAPKIPAAEDREPARPPATPPVTVVAKPPVANPPATVIARPPVATAARDEIGPRDPNTGDTAAALPPAAAAKPVPAPAVQAAEATPPKPAKPVVADAVPAKPVPAKTVTAEVKPPAAKPAGWRVQLGAFSSRKQADAAWASVKSTQGAAIGKAKPIFDTAGSVVKFQLGPYASRDAAKDTCAKLAFAGRACFVTQG